MKAVIRGGGDLGSGVAVRLYRSGIQVLIAEIEMPLALRRTVSFANAVYENYASVEGLGARKVSDLDELKRSLVIGEIPVAVDPELYLVNQTDYDILVDARMLKRELPYALTSRPMIIGLGPGFTAGKNCHAVIETNRGHYLGRVIWEGSAQPNTGIPGKIAAVDRERIIRAPTDGFISGGAPLGKLVDVGEIIGYVSGTAIRAAIGGYLRGLMHDGIYIQSGEKIGDIDPRMDPKLIHYVSDKSLAIAGGVLEAILTFFGFSG